MGEVPEWPKGADCKSAGVSLRRFESSPLHDQTGKRASAGRLADAGIAQLVRARAFQARGRGFESRFPLLRLLPPGRGPGAWQGVCQERGLGGGFVLGAQVAQSAEHVLGKDEVGGSIPLLGFESAAGLAGNWAVAAAWGQLLES